MSIHRPMRELQFRTATEADLERVLVIHGSAFPDPRREPARRRNFRANALGTIDDLWIALDGDVIVAHAFLFRLEAHFGGCAVPVAGIASVGVAPEARGQGVATALLEHLHVVARSRGVPIALLWAFRQAFYARLGYGPVSTTGRLAFAPEAVPRHWGTNGALAATAGARPALEGLYERVAERHTGWLRRPRALWDAKWLDERNHVVFVGPAAAPRGYVLFAYEQAHAHARTTILVEELVAEDAESKRALWGFLGAQAGQVAEIEVPIELGDPTPFALRDADGRRFGDALVEHRIGELVAGPMVKVLDLDAALAARGYLYDTKCRVAFGGRTLALSGSAGRVTVEPAPDADVEIDEEAVASVLFGGLTPSAAAALGLARGTGPALANADALLGLPAFFAIDPF
jgi:predicted acetyltransferase